MSSLYHIYRAKNQWSVFVKISGDETNINTLKDAKFICNWIKNTHPNYRLKIKNKKTNEIYFLEED